MIHALKAQGLQFVEVGWVSIRFSSLFIVVLGPRILPWWGLAVPSGCRGNG